MKRSGRTEPYPSDVSDNGESEGEQQVYSDTEEIVTNATKPSSPSTVSDNYHDSSSDSSSESTSNGRKKSKNSRNTEKALAGVRKLELSQSNTDAQLKNIIDGQNEIKSMFKSAQSDLKAVKDSVKDLYSKHDNTQNTVRIIQESIVSNTLAIKTNFEIAKEI